VQFSFFRFIASIAFGEKISVLDGNVIRIITRLSALDYDISKPRTIKELLDLADSFLFRKEPGNFNQAMMELGATVCSPENPRCAKCPVKSHCVAHSQRRETAYPVKGRREITETKKNAALVCWRGGEVLIQRQPKEGRWGGLWMFPFWESEKKMIKETNIAPDHFKRLMAVQHSFTKYRIQLQVFESYIPYYPPFPHESRWVPVKDLQNYAFPSPHQKIVENLARS